MTLYDDYRRESSILQNLVFYEYWYIIDAFNKLIDIEFNDMRILLYLYVLAVHYFICNYLTLCALIWELLVFLIQILGNELLIPFEFIFS